MLRPVSLPTIYKSKKIRLKTTSPHKATINTDLNAETLAIPVNALPINERLPENANTIAANMLNTAMTSVVDESKRLE
jgi:hypothetical protein